MDTFLRMCFLFDVLRINETVNARIFPHYLINGTIFEKKKIIEH